jgi:hypothetical protein
LKGALLAVLLTLVGCGADPGPPTVQVGPRAVMVSGEGLQEVVIADEAGLVLARRDLVSELSSLRLEHHGEPGAQLRVTVRAASTSTSTLRVPPSPGPLTVDIDVPSGQGARALSGAVPFVIVAGSSVQATLVLTAEAPGPVTVEVNGAPHEVPIRVAGERAALTVTVPSDGPTQVTVRGRGQEVLGTLEPTVLTREEARGVLALEGIAFPATPTGAPEPARAPGRVSLPAPWWASLLRTTGLGTRGRDRRTPWAFQGVTLRNTGAEPLNVVVRAQVLLDGEPAAAFRPRVRRSAGGTGIVSGLLRVPPGEVATASLPLFVADEELPEGASSFVREITVTPLGGAEPLWRDAAPLHVRRGSTWVSLGFLLGLIGALGGVLLIAGRVGPWVRESRTADLTTIAVFATLAFLVSTAAAVLAGAAGAVLGPFQTFATSLVDDALRYALLATLVTLLPRPGVVTLSVLVTWLMRGVVLGGFGPIDVLFVGGQVFWLESCLWLAGLTRSGDWIESGAVSRWLRLGLGFSTASLLTSLSGLVLSMVLYRLYYAGWYVGALLALPGFLYVWLACGFATGFAQSLRGVER